MYVHIKTLKSEKMGGILGPEIQTRIMELTTILMTPNISYWILHISHTNSGKKTCGHAKSASDMFSLLPSSGGRGVRRTGASQATQTAEARILLFAVYGYKKKKKKKNVVISCLPPEVIFHSRVFDWNLSCDHGRALSWR